MAKITYIEFNGKQHELHIANGQSVMQGAMANGVRGIIAECGGNCSCATCHVYVDPAWLDKLNPPSEDEAGLIDNVCDSKPNSRLSCQLKVSDQLEGLIVRMPAKQV